MKAFTTVAAALLVVAVAAPGVPAHEVKRDLRDIREAVGWLNAAEKSFEF